MSELQGVLPKSTEPQAQRFLRSASDAMDRQNLFFEPSKLHRICELRPEEE